MKLKPVSWKLLIRMKPIDEGDVKSKGGIIIATEDSKKKQDIKDRTEEAYVVAIGSNCFIDPNNGKCRQECKIGDLIIISQYAGKAISSDLAERCGLDPLQHYRFLNDDDVHGVVPKSIYENICTIQKENNLVEGIYATN